MVDRCSKCGAKFVRFPIKDEQGKIIWKNLFKMDMMSILFLICIIFMVIGYMQDIKQCNKVIEDPCGFCDKSGCCEITYQGPEQTFEAPTLNINIDN